MQQGIIQSTNDKLKLSSVKVWPKVMQLGSYSSESWTLGLTCVRSAEPDQEPDPQALAEFCFYKCLWEKAVDSRQVWLDKEIKTRISPCWDCDLRVKWLVK